MAHIYPIDTAQECIYQKKVWGDSQSLETILGALPHALCEDVIGEIFLASTHPDGKSSFLDGKSFDEVIASESCKRIFGHGVYGYGAFPLLLKILSATEPLSMQTHYSNKVEAWYALSDGAMLYGLTSEGERLVVSEQGRHDLGEIMRIEKSVKKIAQYFNYVEFAKGDVYIIHAGMAHALLHGTIFEPQKNSNLTNRGGDWGRNDPKRPLQLDDFFASMYPFAVKPHAISRLQKDVQGASKCLYSLVTTHFVVEEMIIDGAYTRVSNGRGFAIGICIDGIVEITGDQGSYQCIKGSVFVVPAVAGKWTYQGAGIILYTYVPHIMRDIIMPLINQGVALDDIVQLGGNVRKENDIYITMKEHGIM